MTKNTKIIRNTKSSKEGEITEFKKSWNAFVSPLHRELFLNQILVEAYPNQVNKVIGDISTLE